MASAPKPVLGIGSTDLPPPARDPAVKRWAFPALVGLALLPLIVSAISLGVRVGNRYHPLADQALIEMQIRDIGEHPVLLGPYSRFGWNHPGPILFYLLWLPYRLTGSTGISLGFAALALNAAAVIGIALLARRRGGLPLLLLTLVLVELLMLSLGAQFFRDTWNPYITILPLVLLVFLAWSASEGDVWAIPVGAGVATLLVQTHLSYGLLTAAVSVAGLVGFTATEWGRRTQLSTEHRRAWLRPGLATAIVLGVLWFPVVLEQFTQEPGNAGMVLRFFREHGTEQSASDAWHVMAMQLAAPPEWLVGATPFNTFTGVVDLSGRTPVAVALAVLVAVTVTSYFRSRDAFRLDCIVLIALLAGFVAVTRIVGSIIPYLTRWTWALGMLTWVAIGWSIVRIWRSRSPAEDGRGLDKQVGGAFLAIFTAGLLGLSAINTVSAADAGNPDPVGSVAVAELTQQVRDSLPPGDGVVELRAVASFASVWVGTGIADELERQGVSTRVERSLRATYGPNRVLDGEPVRLVVLPVGEHDVARARALREFHEVGGAGEYTLFVQRP